ncbi:AAA family ATPase [Geodermatophilus ruber]|uniref:AAA family ATPase n=1 Tax=Geodermatophilus ruber TaxID=504800 RepID=UPI0015A56B37|nr:AAA family ATPase [Geodermatophilus ruber]
MVAPLGERKGYDVSDSLDNGGTVEQLEALACAAEPESGPEPKPEEPDAGPRDGILNLRTSAEVRDMPDPLHLIGGVVPDGVIFQVHGPAGQYKSFLSLAMLLSVANGVPWLGHAITRSGRVVYVLSEGGKDPGSRIRAWLAAHPGCTDDNLLWAESAIQARSLVFTADSS